MTKIVGILNYTPNSFSDGGKFNHIDNALMLAEDMIKNNVSVIDFGAESTAPFSREISVEEEWSRIELVLPKIINLAHKNSVQVSLDSRNFVNIQKALDLGIDIINDVSGLKDQRFLNLIKKNNQAKYILMHSLVIPAIREIHIDPNEDIIRFLKNWCIEKLNIFSENDIDINQMIFDPGIGFGKIHKHSMEIIFGINEFKELNLPLYFGHSKKGFLKEFFTSDKIPDIATNILSNYLINQKVDYIRVHDYVATNQLKESMEINKELVNG